MSNNRAYIDDAEKMRAEWAKSDAKRDKDITIPDDVKMVKNIEYAESSTRDEKIWHLTDIYYPKEKKDIYPVIVSVHGGGWFYGDKELYRPYAAYLASKGFAVVNFNYRRSPEYVYPCGFKDVCYLMDFVIKNAKKYKLDMDRLYMVGDSVGAQLASQYSIYSTSCEYRALFDFSDKTDFITPKKIALNCGIYDMSELYCNDKQLIDWYLPEDRSDFIRKSFFNILEYMNTDFPPTYIMLSVNDAFSIYTGAMKSCLEKHGITMVYREFGQENKNDGHVFHLNLRSRAGELCNTEEIAFFNN